MSGVQIQVDIPSDEVDRRLSRLGLLPNFEFLDSIGALVVSQTQRRIDTEKTSPEGEAWKANHKGTDTLVESGALRDTIDHEIDGKSILVGSPLIYARIHQFGGTIVPKEAAHLVFEIGGKTVFVDEVTIPARPFLGISAANQNEIIHEAVKIIERLIA
jgi:phage gpG-like protein